MNRLDTIEKAYIRRRVPHLQAGDQVRIHTRIKEGTRERIQVYEGVILRVRGSGTRQTITVRKVSYSVGVERIFPVQSPAIAQIELVSHGKVRQSRIYYMRERFGKKARMEKEAVSPDQAQSTELKADASATDAAKKADKAKK